jgi:hypothetical protein
MTTERNLDRLKKHLADAAFPIHVGVDTVAASVVGRGLTKREKFAESMMHALVLKGDYSLDPRSLAQGALLRADALLEALTAPVRVMKNCESCGRYHWQFDGTGSDEAECQHCHHRQKLEVKDGV